MVSTTNWVKLGEPQSLKGARLNDMLRAVDVDNGALRVEANPGACTQEPLFLSGDDGSGRTWKPLGNLSHGARQETRRATYECDAWRNMNLGCVHEAIFDCFQSTSDVLGNLKICFYEMLGCSEHTLDSGVAGC